MFVYITVIFQLIKGYKISVALKHIVILYD